MQDLTDKALIYLPELKAMICHENLRQLEKWGIQTHSPFEWLAYLTEEIGELANAISENHYRDGPIESIVSEAISVTTLALKIAEMYHQVGLK